MVKLDRKTIRMFSMLGQRGTCGYTLAELAEQDQRILCMTADLCITSGLDRFQTAHPDRMLNAGIAEQNMVGIAAGLTMDGYQVFASTFATFASMRAAEQLRTLLAYMNLNVKLIGMASGFSMGFFGNTHYSMEDLAITRAIPNLTVLSPADAGETAKIMEAAAKIDGPCYIRLTGAGNMPVVYKEDYFLEIGRAVTLRQGCDVCFLATGSMVYQSLQAADQLLETGISCSVVNMHTIKPLDTEAVRLAAASHQLMVTVEEHSAFGGLGSAVAEVLAENSLHPPLVRIAVQDCFPRAGSYSYLQSACGLDAVHIVQRTQKALSALRN